jgi:coenzyme F420 hydrogenase subunit beta
MNHEEFKTFRELREEVVLKGLCGKCGGCVSFCSAGELHALEMGEDDVPRYTDEKRCLYCGICYMICPTTKDLDAEMQDNFGWKAPIGQWETISSARATDEAIRAVATDGGVVTALLCYMLESRLIDGAIVSRKTAAFAREPMIATTREELIAAAGSHFGDVAHLEELAQKYTTYSPTISAVKGLEGRDLQRVAMVGAPCQIRSIRKMQCLGILPAHIIHHTIGLFCMENLLFDLSGRKMLEDKLQIDLADIDKLNIKEDIIITLQDGTAVHLPFEEADELARPACLACTDFANDYADLSAGGLGSPTGYTTMVIRSDKGSRVYTEALRGGYIEERAFSDYAELRSERTKMMARVVAFAQRKRARGQARLSRLT